MPTAAYYPQDGFDYGGGAISYNPARNSLFMLSHPYKQMIGEISIPAIGGQSVLLQPLTDAFEGHRTEIAPAGATVYTGGTLVYGDKLIMSAYVYYDGDGLTTLSHFVRPVDLSVKGQVQGPLRVGSQLGAGFYGGYMGSIPSAWQAAFGGPAFTGLALIPVMGRTSFGPSAHAFNPTNIASDAKSLVYYPINHPTLGYEQTSKYFSLGDQITGVVMPAGTSTVLFFGKHGSGQYCYGNGTSDAPLTGTLDSAGTKWCYDPTSAPKGIHTYPYSAYVWAYDANDLAAVRAGLKQPWEVMPYDAWALPGLSSFVIAGAAYDPSTSRIYLSAAFGDGEFPRVEVLSVGAGGGGGSQGPVAPPPPSNVRIVQ